MKPLFVTMNTPNHFLTTFAEYREGHYTLYGTIKERRVERSWSKRRRNFYVRKEDRRFAFAWA